jgi:hypothetical protein
MRKEAERPTKHYIWRTRSDDKVRSSHAENNGRIFSWDNAPPTGHPGEDFGCRCTAEPYYGDIEPTKLNNLRDRILARLFSLPYWGDLEMTLYFFVGNGNGVTLNEIGHLVNVINLYEEKYIERFYAQIIQADYQTNGNNIVVDFESSYDFSDVLYSYRKSTIKGIFAGNVNIYSNEISIIGKANFIFEDDFKDPLSILQAVVLARKLLQFVDEIEEENFSETFKTLANIGRSPYKIRDNWSKEINFTAKGDDVIRLLLMRLD